MPLRGQERLSQAEALRLAFPAPLRVERRTAYLEPGALDSARTLAGADVEISQGVVTYYVGLDGATPVATAYFDGHLVRSKHEVAMIVVDRAGRVRQVEILRFDEPPEYRASRRWLDQFRKRTLSRALSLKGEIMNLTGATLTSRALVRASRRVLALDAVINPLGLPR